MISGIAFVVALHSTAALAGAKIPIDGVVLHVDKLHHQATIKYAALDTAPGGVRVVAITDPKACRKLWVGESIHAIADTSHTPWMISRVVEIIR